MEKMLGMRRDEGVDDANIQKLESYHFTVQEKLLVKIYDSKTQPHITGEHAHP